MFYVRQIQEDDCGFAAFKSLAANIYKKEDYLYLPQDESHGVYSFIDLIKEGEKVGLTLKGVISDNRDTDIKEVTNITSDPFIALIKKGETSHYVTVMKVGKKFVKYFDPNDGIHYMVRAKFSSLWEKKALVVEKSEEIINFVDNKMTFNKERGIALILEVFGISAFVLAFYFIRNESAVYIPIILLAIGIIVQIVLQKYLTIVMKKFDSYEIDNLEEAPKDKVDFLKRFSSYKSLFFTSPLSFITSTCLIILISLVLLENNIYNFIIIMVAILVLVIDKCFISPRLYEKENTLKKEELRLNKYEDLEDFKYHLQEIHNSCYELVMKKNALKYISLFALLLSVILVMIFSQVVSVPFVLLYFAFAFTLYQQLEKIIGYPEENERLKELKVRLNNSKK